MDATKPILGLEPFVFYTGCTVACMGEFVSNNYAIILSNRVRGGLGYLIGPTVGAAGWRLTHRRTMKLIDARDREFHKRIVKNRVDPTAQSATNPVPDFYGKFHRMDVYFLNLMRPTR